MTPHVHHVVYALSFQEAKHTPGAARQEPV
jgi:hypothetical protein